MPKIQADAEERLKSYFHRRMEKQFRLGVAKLTGLVKTDADLLKMADSLGKNAGLALHANGMKSYEFKELAKRSYDYGNMTALGVNLEITEFENTLSNYLTFLELKFKEAENAREAAIKRQGRFADDLLYVADNPNSIKACEHPNFDEDDSSCPDCYGDGYIIIRAE